MLKRPQDHARAEIAQLIVEARQHKFAHLYETNRVPIADQRLDIPRELPFTATFNKYSANVAGTTYYPAGQRAHRPLHQHRAFGLRQGVRLFHRR